MNRPVDTRGPVDSRARHAKARINPPGEGSPSRVPRLFPAVASGTVLLTAFSILIPSGFSSSNQLGTSRQEKPAGELIHAFLDGTGQARNAAREELLHRGPAVLPDLLVERERCTDRKRITPLREIILDLKEEAGGTSERERFRKLRTIRITPPTQNATLSSFARNTLGLNHLDFAIDPVIDADQIRLTTRIEEVPVLTFLDQLLEPAKLDFDVRWGVIFISLPRRLWATPVTRSPVAMQPGEEAKTIHALVSRLGSDSPEDRESAMDALRTLGPAALPILEEHLNATDSEIAQRCRKLVKELRPRSNVWGSIPRFNEWRSQDVQGSPFIPAVLQRLESVRYGGDPMNLESFIGLLPIEIEAKGKIPAGKCEYHVNSARMVDMLELLTLPQGWDVRIEDGVLTLIELPN